MTINISHFSDVLCIWAYIAQIRLEELQTEFGSNIAVDYHFFPVFGDVPEKMEKQWQDKGGITAYCNHVREVAADFNHIVIHPNVWANTTPVSSFPAHLHLCAVRLLESNGEIEKGHFENLIARIREAFFQYGQDISAFQTLEEIIWDAGLPLSAVQHSIKNGMAFTALSADITLAKDSSVAASPTLIFNEGRQRLTGNVGYKIIQANVRELLEQPAQGLSWC